MIIEKTQGITLQSIPYKEKQRIISVFTKDEGIISLIIKGLSEKKISFLSLTTPFCLADIIYKKGRSDIYFLKDVSII
ncbi:MAG: DNA repair protein RecO, partial [Simkaniaceae bacterium]|nr:DNA repair protein RecO [Simkaniaceae bacterium]